MTAGEFHIFAIVEGRGEIDAVPALLHKIWQNAGGIPVLRTDEAPYFVPKGSFLNNAEKRRRSLFWGANNARAKGGGVLILMDADSKCCRDFLHGDKMKEIRGDFGEIFGEHIPHFFCIGGMGIRIVAGGGTGRRRRRTTKAVVVAEHSPVCVGRRGIQKCYSSGEIDP